MTKLRTKYGHITDVKETSDGVVYVKAESGGEPIGGYYPDKTVDQPVIPQQAIGNIRIIKTAPDAKTALKVAKDYAAIIGSPLYRFVSSERYGNFVMGPTTFTAHPESIRIGSVYRFNGLLTSTVPSTIVTPVPALKLDLPGENIINLLQDLQKSFERLINI